MAKVLDYLIKDKSDIADGVMELNTQVSKVISENDVLKTIIEKQGALIVTLNDKLDVVSTKLDDVYNKITVSNKTTDELKHTKFYGQKVKILDSAMKEASEMSNASIRRLIHRAAASHPSGRRKGYTHIYLKTEEVTGVNVYDLGKTVLKKSDGIEGWSKDPSYINTILKEGLQKEVAVICQQILADK